MTSLKGTSGDLMWHCDGPGCTAMVNMTNNQYRTHRTWSWAFVPHGEVYMVGLKTYEPALMEQHWCPRCGAIVKDLLLEAGVMRLDRAPQKVNNATPNRYQNRPMPICRACKTPVLDAAEEELCNRCFKDFQTFAQASRNLMTPPAYFDFNNEKTSKLFNRWITFLQRNGGDKPL